MKNYIYLMGFFLVILSACDMEKDINIKLPDYESKLVVECYLEHGKPYRMNLSESISYLDEPQPLDVVGALVTITHNGVVDTLKFRQSIDIIFNKYYNYRSETLVDSTSGGVYELKIIDPEGRTVMASTSFLSQPSIREIEWEFNDDDEVNPRADAKALILTKIEDNPDTENWYRIIMNEDSLGGKTNRDFAFRDVFASNNIITLGTGYDFDDHDTLVISVYHIEKSFYEYYRSLEDAAEANGNPFAQPGRILSAVEGGIGIFTALSIDRDTIIIEKRR